MSKNAVMAQSLVHNTLDPWDMGLSPVTVKSGDFANSFEKIIFSLFHKNLFSKHSNDKEIFNKDTKLIIYSRF